jgi:hypothetical protein
MIEQDLLGSGLCGQGVGLNPTRILVANCPAPLETPDFLRLTSTKDWGFMNSPPVLMTDGHHHA